MRAFLVAGSHRFSQLANFPNTCRSGWTYKEDVNKCYKAQYKSKGNSWSDSEIKCNNWGGNLAEIRSEAEQKAFVSVMHNEEDKITGT